MMALKPISNRITWAFAWVFGVTGTTVLGALSVFGQISSAKLNVAAVQFRSSFDIHENCNRMTDLLDRLAARGIQVAVFPECALTGYSTGPSMPISQKDISVAEEKLRQVCREKKIAAIFGSVYKVNGHVYDTAVVYSSSGELIERYGKLYLAGEKWAVPGNHISFFQLDGIPSTVMICHDERYPELVRLPALQGAEVVYYISAESSLKEESKLAPYRAQMMARAVENSVYVVAANAPANDDLTGSHGQSRIIASDGNILNEASMFGEDVLTSTLSLKNGMNVWPQNSLKGLLGEWWHSGVELMMKNCHRQLD